MKELGKVTSEELIEIERIYRRKIALANLFLVLSNKQSNSNEAENDYSMYEKLVEDMGITQMKMDTWWKRIAGQYNWKFDKKNFWEVDFETGKIYLHNND